MYYKRFFVSSESQEKETGAAVHELWIHFSLGYFFDSKRQDESTDNPCYSDELTSDDSAQWL